MQLRLACISRVLWQNRDQPIPPPKLGMYGGGVSIEGNQSTKPQDWPLFPVAKEGKSYFVVCGGRAGTGISHRLPSDYFKRCQSSGSFLTKETTLPTKKEAEQDAIRLRHSTRWTKAFSNRGDEAIWESIESQIPSKIE
ncbi:MAG: hypothetical protein ACE361_20280 [Aureliella sp.]